MQVTLPKTNNFAPENRPFAQKKKASSSQPSIFQVRNVSFRVSGRVTNWIGHLVTLFSKASNGIHFEPKIQVSSSDAANLQISESLAEVIEESGGFKTAFFGWVFVDGKTWMLKPLENLWKLWRCVMSLVDFWSWSEGRFCLHCEIHVLKFEMCELVFGLHPRN